MGGLRGRQARAAFNAAATAPPWIAPTASSASGRRGISTVPGARTRHPKALGERHGEAGVVGEHGDGEAAVEHVGDVGGRHERGHGDGEGLGVGRASQKVASVDDHGQPRPAPPAPRRPPVEPGVNGRRTSTSRSRVSGMRGLMARPPAAPAIDVGPEGDRPTCAATSVPGTQASATTVPSHADDLTVDVGGEGDLGRRRRWGRPPSAPAAPAGSLGREPQGAVEADVLAVEVGVAGDRLDEQPELRRLAHALREDDVLRPGGR